MSRYPDTPLILQHNLHYLSRTTLSLVLLFVISLQFLWTGSSTPALAQGGSSWTHSLVQDFSSCSILSNTSITNSADGEIRLAARIEDYFDDTSVNTNRWVVGIGNGGYGTPPRLENGVLIVNASWISSTLAISASDLPVAVEGRVRFISPNQQAGIEGFVDVGLGDVQDVNVTKANDANALFITGQNNVVYANAYQPGYYPDTSGRQRTQISNFDWSQFHNIRLVLGSNRVDYYVDNMLQATHNLSVPLTQIPLYLWFYNLNPGYDFAADWLRLALYPASGQFTSCPIDTGATTDWGVLQWQGDFPAGTSTAFETRSSNDGITWSDWSALGAGNTITSPSARYLQYQAILNSTDQTLSPEIQQVTVNAAGAVPTATNTPVMPTATNTPTPGAPTPTNTPVPPTATNTPVAPTATNTPAVGVTLTPQGSQFYQSTAADFAACSTLNSTFISNEFGGEVRLQAELEDYFEGSSLDTSRWTAAGGSISFSNGAVQIVDGSPARIRSNATYLQRTLEARVRFTQANQELMGFSNFNGSFAVFGTRTDLDPNSLYAWSNGSGGEQITALSGVNLTSYHDYRLVWGPNSVEYWVDGVLAATHSRTLNVAMYAHLTNWYGTGANVLAADWLRLANYPANGNFSSCLLNAGQTVNWTTMNWSSNQPGGATLQAETRSSADGATWSGWSSITNGAAITSPASRYLQYRFTFGTTQNTQTARLDEIAVNFDLNIPTATPTVENTPTPLPTNTAEPTATNTAEPATATATATNTAVPPTATSTNTPVPPTATPTNTAVPPTATATNTPIPPTATPTNTSVPPTTTATNTSVPPTATATNTPVPPTVTATNTPVSNNVLQNGVSRTSLSGSQGSRAYFTMSVPAGARNLQLRMSGGSGDADLYVRFGSQPTLSSYNCRPYLDGNNETCTFSVPQVGTYQVMLYGYASYSGVSLVGSYQGNSTPVPPTVTPTNTPVPPTATPTNTPVSATTNLALNRSVASSSNYASSSYPVSYAVDSNTSTIWYSGGGSSAANTQWIYVDLGASYNISRVRLTWGSSYLARDYQIQVSASSSGPWTTLQTLSNNSSSVNDRTGLSGTGRYVRIYATRGNNLWYGLTEFEVYGSSTSTLLATPALASPTLAATALPPTATPTTLPATATPMPTATSVPGQPTVTAIPPTVTNTPEPTATNTPEPTATNTPEPTATNSPEPTATNTPEPTATNTPEPTATDTPASDDDDDDDDDE